MRPRFSGGRLGGLKGAWSRKRDLRGGTLGSGAARLSETALLLHMEGSPGQTLDTISKGDKTETSKAWGRHTGGDPGTRKPGGCQTVWHLHCHW